MTDGRLRQVASALLFTAAAVAAAGSSSSALARLSLRLGQAPPRQPIDRERAERTLKAGTEALEKNAFEEALGILTPLVETAPELGPAFSGAVHDAIATAYYRMTNYPDAMRHFEQALEGERAAGARAAEANTLRAVAQLDKNRGAYAEGLERAEQARAVYESIDNAREAARTWIVIGAIHDLMGDHRQALESYQHAVPVLGNERSANAANLLYEMGITYKNLGAYSDALRSYTEALDIYAALNDVRNQAVTFGNLGNLYDVLGDDENAITYRRRALDLSRQIGDRRFEMIGSLNLAESYWSLGRRSQAIEMLQQALGIARAVGARSEQNVALKDLGDVHAASGDLALARQEYNEAIRIERDMGERRTEASTMVALSDLSIREGRSDEALDSAKQALSLVLAGQRPELEWTARRAVAAAESASGRVDDAIDELRASGRIINDLRANVPTDMSKIAFVDRRQDVFQDLAALFVSRGRVAEGLEAAEAGRARAFADLLAQRQIVGKPRERDALAAVRRSEEGFRAALTNTPRDSTLRAATSLATTRGAEALVSSIAALRTEHRELASLLTAESPTAAQVAATAKRLDATFIEYLVLERQLLVWVVGADGAIHAASVNVTREHLEALTKDVRDAIERLDARTLRRRKSIDSRLRELDSLLIEPVAQWLPRSADTDVIVVPHGPLAVVPFAALEDAGRRPLAERYTLSFAPAASVYEHTGDKIRTAKDGSRILVVADPTPPAGSGLEALPWAREEGQRVAARLRGTEVRLLTGDEASEASVKREAGSYSRLHFATHGLVVADRPLASSILLGAGAGEDGYLRVDEIFGLELSADLVVLSGCSTGLGRPTGDGIIGLTRAFIYAGTPTVIVSQWDVRDRATAFLMDRFYAALRVGHRKAAALRSAELATRRRYPHPALWAAFTLVGEPR